MNIPELTTDLQPSTINAGPKAGSRSYYRDALYATLKHLKPKVCLETGTHYGVSGSAFTRYFDEERPDGVLITCDIKHYTKIEHPRVKQVLVHPYVDNSSQWHDVNNADILPAIGTIEAIRANAQIIKDALLEFGIDQPVDFAFIDGDHQETSFMSEVLLAKRLLVEPGYMLIDDIDEFDHDCARIYHDDIKVASDVETYQFEDWNRYVGAALVWEKR